MTLVGSDLTGSEVTMELCDRNSQKGLPAIRTSLVISPEEKSRKHVRETGNISATTSEINVR